MKTTFIKVPAHWPAADLCDIERELVGLIVEKEQLGVAALVDVRGVRHPGVYGARWATVRRSRFLRRAGWTMEVWWR